VHQILSNEELRRYLANATQRERLLVELILHTGCTISDLVALTPHACTARGIRIGTTYHKLPQQLRIALRAHAGKKYLFASRQGAQLTARRVQQIVRAIGERASIPRVTPHTLRRTALVKAAKHGETQSTLAKRFSITERWVRETLGAVAPQPPKQMQLPRDPVVALLHETAATIPHLATLTTTDLRGTTLRIGPRSVELSEELAGTLRSANRIRTDALLTQRNGRAASERWLQFHVKKTLRTNSVLTSAHELRYEAIRVLAARGASVSELARALSLKEQRIAAILGSTALRREAL
jgi:hypothetical protein